MPAAGNPACPYWAIIPAMVPPKWLGEPTSTCPRCGSIVGPMHLRAEHLKMVGWAPYRVETYINLCGHGQEVIPFPLADGSVRFVPIVGESR